MPRHMATFFIEQGDLIEVNLTGDSSKPLSACCLV